MNRTAVQLPAYKIGEVINDSQVLRILGHMSRNDTAHHKCWWYELSCAICGRSIHRPQYEIQRYARKLTPMRCKMADRADCTPPEVPIVRQPLPVTIQKISYSVLRDDIDQLIGFINTSSVIGEVHARIFDVAAPTPHLRARLIKRCALRYKRSRDGQNAGTPGDL